ncbi:hypothetical protein S40288_11761 [Stachybotrys chartarum IBT 40288]|nr:hypothetical protein S40288_11761 [Stachybotrys chartarum IBT 40288]
MDYNVPYILIAVFVMAVIASLLRVNSILLVHQQRRQSPVNRQFEALMTNHKLGFLLVVIFHVVVSIIATSIFFPLALRGADHWSPLFLASTVVISIVGQSAWLGGQWNLEHHRWHFGAMVIGLTVTLAVFLCGVSIADEQVTVGIFMFLAAITFFRLWMVLEWMVIIWRTIIRRIIIRSTIIRPTRTASTATIWSNEAYNVVVIFLIEVSFAIVVLVACILAIYNDMLRSTYLFILGLILEPQLDEDDVELTSMHAV